MRHASKSKGDSFATNVVAALLVLAFYYLSYRYPLQIGSSQTSPTYSNTPLPLQVGKYVAVGLVLVIAIFLGTTMAPMRAKLQEHGHAFIASAFALVSTFALVKGAILNSIDMLTLGMILLAGAVLMTLPLRWKLDANRLARIILVYAVLSLLAQGAELYLFQTQGRLPALGYLGSTSVRFGAILDDPNGFAVLVGLLLPVVVIDWKKRPLVRFITGAGLVVALLLTQSFTGIASVALALVLGGLAINARVPNRFLAIFLGALAIGASALIVTTTSVVFRDVLQTKTGSIDAHGTVLATFQALSPQAFIGLGTPSSDVESSYVSLIANFGLLFAIVWVALGVFALARLYRTIVAAPNRQSVALHYALFVFVIAYLLASLNLNLERVFPVNLLYVLAICISTFQNRGELPETKDIPLVIEGENF